MALVLKAFQGILKCSGSWESQSCYFVIPGAPGKRQWRMGTCQTLKEDPKCQLGSKEDPNGPQGYQGCVGGGLFPHLKWTHASFSVFLNQFPCHRTDLRGLWALDKHTGQLFSSP